MVARGVLVETGVYAGDGVGPIHKPTFNVYRMLEPLESRRVLENEYRRKLENGKIRNIEPYPRGRRLLENEFRRLLG